MSNTRVAALVVTFNRKELLSEAIDALLHQSFALESVFIVDNASTDGTDGWLFLQELIDRKPPESYSGTWESEKRVVVGGNEIAVRYVRLPENTGGAGGFAYGLSRVLEHEYDWIWVMDDDAEPKGDALMELSRHFGLKDIAALVGTVAEPDGQIQVNHRGYIRQNRFFPSVRRPVSIAEYDSRIIDIDTASFVGSLFNVNIVRMVDLPRADFFIYNDDVEYFLRIRDEGRVCLVPKSVIVHKDVAAKRQFRKKALHLRTYRIPSSTMWLLYYGQRNFVHVAGRICRNRILFYLQMTLCFLRQAAAILLFDSFKRTRIDCLSNAYIDGVRGRFDNRYPRALGIRMARTLAQPRPATYA